MKGSILFALTVMAVVVYPSTAFTTMTPVSPLSTKRYTFSVAGAGACRSGTSTCIHRMPLKAARIDDDDGKTAESINGPGTSNSTDIRKAALCIRESVYDITRGKLYDVLDRDDNKRAIRIVHDKGRTRWLPTYCFDFEKQNVPVLKNFTIDDDFAATNGAIEVSFELSDGTSRWCNFWTPSRLASVGDWVPGTRIPFHYDLQHSIVVNELSEDSIERILHYIDGQGDLMACSLPLEEYDDDGDDDWNDKGWQ